MSSDPPSTGPDQGALIRLIRETWPDTVVAVTDGAAFFSLDERHWPNFATVVWTDAFDEGAPSRLTRPGVYRVNIGVGPETFQRLVSADRAPDYAALDRVVPHPMYAKQRWVSILNPSETTVRDVVLPLVAEAHDRLLARRQRRRRTVDGRC
jgi:uncharacterized protein DUF6194